MADNRTTTGQIAEAVTRTDGASLAASLIAGLLIGLLLDRWLGTDPWFTISFIVVGALSGFMRVWKYAKAQGAIDDAERKSHGR